MRPRLSVRVENPDGVSRLLTMANFRDLLARAKSEIREVDTAAKPDKDKLVFRALTGTGA